MPTTTTCTPALPKVRYRAPAREELAPMLCARPPFAHWPERRSWIEGDDWPTLDALNHGLHEPGMRFVAQTPALLADGLHYEERIALTGGISTREENWHDLLNAMIWLRYPSLKQALNARQFAEIAVMGRRERSRAQCALTLFDESGIVVGMRDAAMLEAWDTHDWPSVFLTHRHAWLDGSLRVYVFGHALLEHSLSPETLLVGKALPFLIDDPNDEAALIAACANAVANGSLLNDPQELRPLPVSGIPGWHPHTANEHFYRDAPCFRPAREGRVYPPATVVAG
jgi:Protein of unknown function (DUF3025)